MSIDKFHCYRVIPITKMDYNNVKKDSNKFNNSYLYDSKSNQKNDKQTQKPFQEIFLNELTKKK